ncbi:NAD(P)-dependent oxidoreductase [Kineococcus esterisolvens]|uniref:NAD(P)-dependent oxidoreductase n=1 Tax=unclassified Kineococcus TaxID=2621656 RepID=UPI003D7DACA4
MARVTVLGGTGYAGSRIARELAARGHAVTTVSRTVPERASEGVRHVAGSVLDRDFLERVVAGDVVVSALAPRGELAGEVRGVLRDVAALAQRKGVRLGVVGGAGSLRVSEDGPRLLDTEAFPEEFKPEAQEAAEVLEDLRGADEALDWFYVSPAAGFGAFAPGERTGSYRTGGDVLLTDEAGVSSISGDDFAIAVADEVERAAHRRRRFTVAH